MMLVMEDGIGGRLKLGMVGNEEGTVAAEPVGRAGGLGKAGIAPGAVGSVGGLGNEGRAGGGATSRRRRALLLEPDKATMKITNKAKMDELPL
ncbi:hypothetical protein QQ045_022940 [Rhodiola kirilowii]